MLLRSSSRTWMLAIGALLGAMFGGFVAAHAAQVAVETFSKTGMLSVDLPGQVINGHVQFTGHAHITALNFTAGSVLFRGHPVDFHGHESDFMATNFAVTASVPDTAGAATVTIPFVGSSSGAVNGEWDGAQHNASLGGTFSRSHLDVVVNSSFVVDGIMKGWTSSVVPELNGTYVEINGPNQIQTVDAVNGVITASGTGTIYADDGAVPALPMWGGALLLVGLIAFGMTYVSRRSKIALAS